MGCRLRSSSSLKHFIGAVAAVADFALGVPPKAVWSGSAGRSPWKRTGASRSPVAARPRPWSSCRARWRNCTPARGGWAAAQMCWCWHVGCPKQVFAK